MHSLPLINWILGFCFMVMAAVVDHKRKMIPLQLLVGMLFAGLVLAVWTILQDKAGMADGVFELFAGCVPGIMLLLVGWCSREQIGYGDGALVMALGAVIGWQRAVGTLAAGLLFMALRAVYLLGIKKVSKDYREAFAPYLLIGLGVVAYVCRG